MLAVFLPGTPELEDFQIWNILQIHFKEVYTQGLDVHKHSYMLRYVDNQGDDEQTVTESILPNFHWKWYLFSYLNIWSG